MCRLFAVAMALCLVGCAGMESGSGNGQRAVPLEKIDWKLVEVEGISVPLRADPREPHIRFDPEKKRMTGYSGVNSFFGSYDTSGKTLRLSSLASTRRAGPPELMQLESAFLKALAATVSYRIAGDKLEILDSGGRALARFEAQETP